MEVPFVLGDSNNLRVPEPSLAANMVDLVLHLKSRVSIAVFAL